MPIFWECQRCTACCRWPGQVKLTDLEIHRLAAHLGLDESVFIQRYTRLRLDRQGLALEEQTDGACIFLIGGSCQVQEVKPRQCLDFPNLWRHPDTSEHCRARPVELEPEEYQRRINAT